MPRAERKRTEAGRRKKRAYDRARHRAANRMRTLYLDEFHDLVPAGQRGGGPLAQAAQRTLAERHPDGYATALAAEVAKEPDLRINLALGRVPTSPNR